MCGIIGIVTQTKKDLISMTIESLIDLEYRGYDSAGIAFCVQKKIKTFKCVGAPSKNLHAIPIKNKLQNNEKKSTSTEYGIHKDSQWNYR